MRQKYKVFLNKRFVLLTNKWPKKLLKSEDYLALQSDDKASIKRAFTTFLHDQSLQKLVLINSDLDKIWSIFSSLFHITKAAGGFVMNEKNEVLLIHRNGYWDLPKGKLELGEKLKKCAVREVEEECGITNISLIKKICTTHHLYSFKNGPVLKPSHWYYMRVNGIPDLTPQKEEGIELAEWVSMKRATALLDLAYPSIREVFKKYHSKISSVEPPQKS